MSIGNNLKALRTKAGYTQKQLADIVGVKHNTISDWENGRTSPDVNNIASLCEVLKIGADILLGTTRLGATLSLGEHEHIEIYRALDTHGRDMVDTVASKELSRLEQERHIIQLPIASEPPEEDEPEPDGCTVYEMPASAGLGNYLEADPLSEQYIFPAGTVPPGTDFGVRVSGDSMEPTIADGSIVFVEECLELRNGEIGIFSLDGEAYCKELYVDRERQEIRLISRNDDYEPITVTINEYTDLRTVGRVLSWWTEE